VDKNTRDSGLNISKHSPTAVITCYF